MNTLDEEINTVIEGLRIGLGTDEAHWSSIESAIRVLEAIVGLNGNIVGIGDGEFERIILDAIDG